MNGGKPVYVPLRAPERAAHETISSHEWRLDIDELRSKITPRTKMIVVNTPHNPIGKVFDEEELLAIGKVAEEHNLLILSDEVVKLSKIRQASASCLCDSMTDCTSPLSQSCRVLRHWVICGNARLLLVPEERHLPLQAGVLVG